MSQDLAKGSGDAQGRSGRVSILAFIADAISEQVLRDGLGELVIGLDLRRGTIRTAIGAMAKLPTPEILIVDLAGEAQPLQALAELSVIVEPGVRVLAIGQTDDVNLYRHITQDLNVLEYLFKPITREAIARHFVPLITRQRLHDGAVRGAQVIGVTGARGGVGASTIAAELAWFLGGVAKRHTLLLDADLHQGAGALMLGGKPRPGLRVALERPDRIDAHLAEHAVQPISDRLHLLASEERLEDPLRYAPGAAARMIEALRPKYDFIVLDLPFLPCPLNLELLNLVHHRVLILDPTLAAIRDCLRLLALPNGPWQPQSPALVLNRMGRPGGLTRRQIEDALQLKIDLAMPDVPRLLDERAGLGEVMNRLAGPFRHMIADLARETGFTGSWTPSSKTSGLSISAWLRRMAPQHG